MIFHLLKSSYQTIKTALNKTRSFFGNKIFSLFKGQLNEETFEQLEELFYEADLGVELTSQLIEKVKLFYEKHPDASPELIIDTIKKELLKDFSKDAVQLNLSQGLSVILLVGVNGNGKTTSAAKLAHLFKTENKKVLLAAADTYRAGAIEQLSIWAQRLNIDIIKAQPKSDPSSVAYDAIQAGIARKADILIIDTAGRLHNKTHLMQELEKIRRTCKKLLPDSPHETLLALDATTGQNGIDQAKVFDQFIPLSGLILTKMDGTAKGGIALAIHRQLRVPIKFISTGENLEDIDPFDPNNYINALFDISE